MPRWGLKLPHRWLLPIWLGGKTCTCLIHVIPSGQSLYGTDVTSMTYFLSWTILPSFATYFNPLGLKFTTTAELHSMPFLNLLLQVKESVVHMSSYCKSTAGNTILHAQLCHPIHTIQNIPAGKIIRAHRKCSDMTDFLVETRAILNRLSYCKYPPWLLKRATKAPFIQRFSLHRKRVRHDKRANVVQRGLRFSIIPYGPGTP